MSAADPTLAAILEEGRRLEREATRIRAALGDEIDRLRLALAEATQRANEEEDLRLGLTRERDEAIRTVNALTPAANYCLQYKPLLMKAERERDEAIRVLRDIATYGWYAKGAKVARAYLTAREGR